jgi:membrane-associated phospholipid phosphatase
MSVMYRVSQVVSAVFHPLIMPLACFFLAAHYDWYIRGTTDPNILRITLLVVALSTIAFPGVNLLLLRWYGVISSLAMPNRAERVTPFLSTLFFFGLGYYLLSKGNLPAPLYSIFVGSMVALLLLTLLSLRWKVSAHGAGVAGVAGSVMALFQLHNYGNIALLSAVWLAAGLTLTARLYLKAHTPGEVYIGAIIGFLSMYLSVLYGLLI